MICYELNQDGQASNLRGVPPDYEPQPSETVVDYEGAGVPDVDTLHSPEYLLGVKRVAACTGIDQAAEDARGRYLTPGTGQAMTYQRKEASARAFRAANHSGIVPPMIQATATARDITPTQAADLIIEQADAWEAIGAAIEQAREAGKLAVTGAEDVAGIETARGVAVDELVLL